MLLPPSTVADWSICLSSGICMWHAWASRLCAVERSPGHRCACIRALRHLSHPPKRKPGSWENFNLRVTCELVAIRDARSQDVIAKQKLRYGHRLLIRDIQSRSSYSMYVHHIRKCTHTDSCFFMLSNFYGSHLFLIVDIKYKKKLLFPEKFCNKVIWENKKKYIFNR